MELRDVRRFVIPEKPPLPYSHSMFPNPRDITWVNLGDLIAFLESTDDHETAVRITLLEGYTP